MKPAQIALYDSGRDLTGKPFAAACYAPFGSMYFDVHGNVIACCQNTRHVLGNVADQSIDEIWHSERASELRDALKAYDLSRGCEFCQWQVDDGNLTNLFATVFDDVRVDAGPDVWPSQLEFALSNTCNLECVMCHGESSSKIRAHRERLAPLPARYGDRFFEEIRPFLRHADRARFFGGEPFLARESFRLWDLMIEDGLQVECNVTTNGTQWNRRVDRVLKALPFTIGISLDGLTRETIEGVRVGASYDQVMRNFKRFHAYAESTGRALSLTYCLMTSNWHEFGDFLQFADDHGCPVYANTVVYPPHLSLYRLAYSDLSGILRSLESQGRTLESRLGRNRHVWIAEVERLKNWGSRLTTRQAGVESQGRLFFEFPKPNPLPLEFIEGASGAPRRPFGRAAAEALLADEEWLGEVSLLLLDDHDLVLRNEDGSGFLGLSQDLCVGRSFVNILASLRERFGSLPRVLSESIESNYVDRRVAYDGTEGRPVEIRMVVWPTFDEEGGITGSCTTAVLVPARETTATPLPSEFLAAMSAPPSTPPIDRAAAEAILADETWLGEVGFLVLDERNVVLDVGNESGFLGLRRDLLIGREFADILEFLREKFGSTPRILSETIKADYVERRVVYDGAEGLPIEVRVVVWPTFDRIGKINGSSAAAVLVPAREGHQREQSVTLGRVTMPPAPS